MAQLSMDVATQSSNSYQRSLSLQSRRLSKDRIRIGGTLCYFIFSILSSICHLSSHSQASQVKYKLCAWSPLEYSNWL